MKIQVQGRDLRPPRERKAIGTTGENVFLAFDDLKDCSGGVRSRKSGYAVGEPHAKRGKVLEPGE